MATTTGLVQQLAVFSGPTACAWIGPSPTNTELLVVTSTGSATDVAFAGGLVDMLSSAMMHRREVVAFHGDSSSQITSLRIDPA
ncbi:MAG TPA: hypothetical protein VNT24_09625 [Propionibacteriaceae bacterium]|nr:hypothetical protein [Propionibacteriaceae bacterium]